MRNDRVIKSGNWELERSSLEIFVVKSMRDCISVSGRWFYGLFEEIVDLFTIKSTGNPKLTSSALGAFILIDDWLVGRLNDGTLCRL